MLFGDPEPLHIPAGINFQCTGCGNCCLQWPVPSTDEDRRRIVDLSRELASPPAVSLAAGSLAPLNSQDLQTLGLEIAPTSQELAAWRPTAGQLFRRVDFDVLKNQSRQFPYTLEKRQDGFCVFLTDNNTCVLHERFGADSKPGMCQLFPYTFTEAPDGFYASVSFASSGALFNQGQPLTEQREHLLTRLALFKKLFPQLKLDWSKIQLFDGQPIRWSQYLLLERDVLLTLTENIKQTEWPQFEWWQCLLSISQELTSKIPPNVDLERADIVPSSEKVDLLLVRYLLNLYLPENVFIAEPEGPSIRALMQDLIAPPDSVIIESAGEFISLSEICSKQLLRLDCQSENLLARYLYSRLHSKLYFGAGMAHFSLISGFHHLGLLIALLRIQLKCLVWRRGAKSENELEEPCQIEFLQVAELVRNLERRLASFQHSSESATILQVLLESPSRFKRLLDLAM